MDFVVIILCSFEPVLPWQHRLLGMDEWIWLYPELHPDQLRVTRLNHTEEIYSPQVRVKE